MAKADESPFIWEGDGVTITPPPDDADAGAEIDAEIARIDALLVEDGVSLADAAPSPLYVSRKVLNAEEIRTWARGQGLTALVVAAELHVTIAYSRAPVDWMEMGQPWEEVIEIAAGGPRVVEIFGESAVVLRFASTSLRWRHEELKGEGASWDHMSYSPHITLSYSGVIPEGLTPYQGRIHLGPELFEELKPHA